MLTSSFISSFFPSLRYGPLNYPSFLHENVSFTAVTQYAFTFPLVSTITPEVSLVSTKIISKRKVKCCPSQSNNIHTKQSQIQSTIFQNTNGTDHLQENNPQSPASSSHQTSKKTLNPPNTPTTSATSISSTTVIATTATNIVSMTSNKPHATSAVNKSEGSPRSLLQAKNNSGTTASSPKSNLRRSKSRSSLQAVNIDAPAAASSKKGNRSRSKSRLSLKASNTVPAYPKINLRRSTSRSSLQATNPPTAPSPVSITNINKLSIHHHQHHLHSYHKRLAAPTKYTVFSKALLRKTASTSSHLRRPLRIRICVRSRNARNIINATSRCRSKTLSSSFFFPPSTPLPSPTSLPSSSFPTVTTLSASAAPLATASTSISSSISAAVSVAPSASSSSPLSKKRSKCNSSSLASSLIPHSKRPQHPACKNLPVKSLHHKPPSLSSSPSSSPSLSPAKKTKPLLINSPPKSKQATRNIKSRALYSSLSSSSASTQTANVVIPSTIPPSSLNASSTQVQQQEPPYLPPLILHHQSDNIAVVKVDNGYLPLRSDLNLDAFVDSLNDSLSIEKSTTSRSSNHHQLSPINAGTLLNTKKAPLKPKRKYTRRKSYQQTILLDLTSQSQSFSKTNLDPHLDPSGQDDQDPDGDDAVDYDDENDDENDLEDDSDVDFADDDDDDDDLEHDDDDDDRHHHHDLDLDHLDNDDVAYDHEDDNDDENHHHGHVHAHHDNYSVLFDKNVNSSDDDVPLTRKKSQSKDFVRYVYDEYSEVVDVYDYSSPKASSSKGNIQPLSSYLRDIGQYRIPSLSDEKKLAFQVKRLLQFERIFSKYITQHGRPPSELEWSAECNLELKEFRRCLYNCRRAKESLIASNLRLVVSLAKKYQNRGLSLHDLIQEGSVGLIRGVERFDAEKGFKLSTYTTYWIRQSMHRAISNSSRMIRLPIHVTDFYHIVNTARKSLTVELGRLPTDEEISKRVKAPVEKIKALSEWAHVVTSLEAPAFNGKDGDPSTRLLGDVIEWAGDTPLDVANKSHMQDQLDKLLDTLQPREKRVLRLRFGLEDGKTRTLQQIAEIYGITKERIRQIEATALRKLRSSDLSSFKDFVYDFI